ncbi:tyrosine recombinase XerC [Pararobbsia silviterrae]|uniref:Tyrosine recombinase XerC n=1 Tax=Pararobbsia silviterrae TaxID=1792498 RepID=A0A494Y8T8_9BURK|nr:tyrosine recombinase XerC [Pararobbsia silviterrae]RKP58565.1 tyrosine recombinase XerC [Pararobbsia silviterrae]
MNGGPREPRQSDRGAPDAEGDPTSATPESDRPHADRPAQRDPLIAGYLSSIANERKLSSYTLSGYTRELDVLAALAGTRPLTALSAVDIRGAAARAHASGLAPRTIAYRLSIWRSFYRWVALHHELPANPVATVRAPKRAKTLPKAISADDAARLMEAPPIHPDHPVESARDKAMLELFYSSGLRLAELVGLDVRYTDRDGYRSLGWIDLDAGDVHVTGKGKRQRIVPVGAKAREALLAWLALRDQWVRHDPHPLFLSVRGNRLSRSVIQDRVKRLALRAGVPANVHPHVLRHSFATHVLQSSGDLRAVQEMLGHASIAATQVYTSLDFQHLAKVYDAAHPRAKKRS